MTYTGERRPAVAVDKHRNCWPSNGTETNTEESKPRNSDRIRTGDTGIGTFDLVLRFKVAMIPENLYEILDEVSLGHVIM